MASRVACQLAFLVAIVLNTPVVRAGGVSPVAKVLQLIDDFAAKVTKDRDTAATLFTESARFCDDESVKTGYAIKNSAKEIESLSAFIEEANAKIEESESTIQATSSQISGLNSELSASVEERERDHNDFVENEKALLDTVKELTGATKTLKQSMGLVQLTPDAKLAVNRALQGLSSVVEASFVTHAQKAKVNAYLQARADAADGLSFRATVMSQQKGSGAIVETLEDMTDKAEGTLADARKAEMKSNHAFMLLKQGMESEIKSLEEQLGDTTHMKQVTTEGLAVAEKDLSLTKKMSSTDAASLRDLKRECERKAEEWEVMTRDANRELTALGKARAILTSKFGALLQAGRSAALVRRAARETHQDDAKARALREIQQLGRRLHSTALVALSYRAAGDPFGKIRGMIEDMIAKLQHEAGEQATQKAFCDEETMSSMNSKQHKEGKLAKVSARIEKAEASIATLMEQVAVLSQQIAEIDAAMSEATVMRQEEKAQFQATERDASASQEACASAIEVLREYYESAALTQVAAHVSRSAGSDGSGIIGLLEVAESDFATMLAEARTIEDAAASDFTKLAADSKLAKATKETDVKAKESELKTLKTTVATYSEDKTTLSAELEAVMQYISELQPQCETKAPTYAETKAKREAEIEGLKSALKTLSS